MYFVLFGLWILFNGRWTTEIALTGAVLCALIYLLMWKFMDYSPRRDLMILKRVPRFAAYVCYLIGEIFKAAWATMKLIWSLDKEPEPQLLSFRSRLKTGWGKTILANSITLTPGTITADVREDRFLVHALDVDFTEGIEDSDMQRRIEHVEGVETK